MPLQRCLKQNHGGRAFDLNGPIIGWRPHRRGGEGHLEQGSFLLERIVLGRVSTVSYQQATLQHPRKWFLKRDICGSLKYPQQWRTSRWVCVCVCVRGFYKYLTIFIGVLSIIQKKCICCHIQFDLCWKDDTHESKSNLQCMWLPRKQWRIKPLSLHQNSSVLPNNGVCGLFVIVGPLTVSAFLISLRWILPNPANVHVVQSVLVSLRQRVKEVNWILKCRQ